MATMDVRFINPFLKATGLVFRTMADSAVRMNAPHIKDARHDLTHVYPVTAVIDISGTTSGVVAMRFCKPVVLSLVKSMLGEAPEEIDDDCLDAMGEVANMVVGNAKRDFPLEGVRISVPRVTCNDPLKAPPILVLPFDCAVGRFLIEARLKLQAQEHVQAAHQAQKSREAREALAAAESAAPAAAI